MEGIPGKRQHVGARRTIGRSPIVKRIPCPSSIPRVTFTSVPCAPNGSEVAAASTFTFPTCTNLTPPSSIASNPERIIHYLRWPSSMSPLPHSWSNPYSPTIIRTQRPSSHPSFVHHCIRPTSSTSSILVGSATMPPIPTPSNTNTSAGRHTAATTYNQRSTYHPSLVTISPISPVGPNRLTRTCNTLRRLIFRLTHPISSCHNGSG